MTDQLPPRVAVIILNWNNWPDTLACLESVRQSDYPNFFVVVCDNASADDSCDRIRRWAAQRAIPLIEHGGEVGQMAHGSLILSVSPENRGYAGGNNAGIRVALNGGAEIIWVLNNDTVVAPDALRQGVAALAANRAAGVVGSLVYVYGRERQISYSGGWVNPLTGQAADRRDEPACREPYETQFVTGCSMFVPAGVIARVGLMSEAYFLYSEDTDWCVRLRRAGWRAYVAPASVVWHKESASLGQESMAKLYYTSRSTLLFVRRCYPYFLPVAAGFAFLRMAWRLLTGRAGQVRPMLCGSIDALRPVPALKPPC